MVILFFADDFPYNGTQCSTDERTHNEHPKLTQCLAAFELILQVFSTKK